MTQCASSKAAQCIIVTWKKITTKNLIRFDRIMCHQTQKPHKTKILKEGRGSPQISIRQGQLSLKFLRDFRETFRKVNFLRTISMDKMIICRARSESKHPRRSRYYYFRGPSIKYVSQLFFWGGRGQKLRKN